MTAGIGQAGQINPYYQPQGSTEAPLFQKYKGKNGRLPQELIDKLEGLRQKYNFKGGLTGDRHENWFDIFSNVDGKRNCVGVKEIGPNVIGSISVAGEWGLPNISPDVLAALKEIDS